MKKSQGFALDPPRAGGPWNLFSEGVWGRRLQRSPEAEPLAFLPFLA